MTKAALITLTCFGFLAAYFAQADEAVSQQEKHNLWLKKQFSQQHQQLIPVVTVADMFYACNKERKIDPINYRISDLVLKMDRDKLADKLTSCLAGDSIKSDVALNFGLIGCFNEQFSEMPAAEKKQNMKLVRQAIVSLSREERQKSLTKCVTEQSIRYLK